MARKPGKQLVHTRFRKRIYLGGPRKPPFVSIYWTRDVDDKLLNYGLAYIDFRVHPGDNGRVLGYDNGHEVHERHFMGHSEVVDFISYEATASRFFAEVRRLRKGGSHGNAQDV